MRSAEVVLCCVTPSYLKIQNCLAEAALSLELGKTMIVAQMENMQWPPRDLLYIFSDKQRVIIVDWLDNKKISVIDTLAQKVKQCLRTNSSRQTKAMVQKAQDDEKHSGGSVQQWSGKQVVQWVCNLGSAYEHYGKKFEDKQHRWKISQGNGSKRFE